MANPKHVKLVLRGAEAIIAWRKENLDARLDLLGANLIQANLTEAPLIEANLSAANLSGANLREANLREANLTSAILSGADLSGADLSGADLSGAHLSEATLSEAYLGGANLSRADLSGANLSGAILSGADLSRANLSNADLSNCRCASTTFGNIDLSKVKSLDSISHGGPSTLGVDTLFLSRTNLPDAFLRGCGVPDALITYLPSLLEAAEPIWFYSCFISHSHKDDGFAKRLHARMREEHLRVWFAPEDMPGGRKLHDEIDRAIRIHEKLLLVLSEHSMNSEWVKTEIRKARKAERETGKQKLFPIRLVDFEAIRKWECFDADSGKDLGVELREYFIPDFSSWKKKAAFEDAFARLLKDLRAKE
jgi:uncharacterized protein YjbI with pentapeptide repeats